MPTGGSQAGSGMVDTKDVSSGVMSFSETLNERKSGIVPKYARSEPRLGGPSMTMAQIRRHSSSVMLAIAPLRSRPPMLWVRIWTFASAGN